MNRILPSGGPKPAEMKRVWGVALVLAGCVAAGPRLCAQAPAAPAGQQPRPASAQKPSAPAAPPAANPFPDDVSTVPVLPSRNTPDVPQGGSGGAAEDSGRLMLSPDDLDPVRSPDDSTSSSGTPGYSSSLNGLDALMPGADTAQPGKGKKGREAAIAPMPVETAKGDLDVGNYYLDNKDWKGALSRFQSALVLDPENPDVYWGLAECERHLGDYAAARDNYLKVMEYDPDSRHAKDAKKALKSPELANAKPAAGQPAAAK